MVNSFALMIREDSRLWEALNASTEIRREILLEDILLKPDNIDLGLNITSNGFVRTIYHTRLLGQGN
jgi:hypothetical protein